MMFLDKSTLTDFEKWLAEAKAFGAAALIDKDLNWTSFNVVAKLRNLFQIKKTGHAGTLDPLATGLLILCFGKATKSIESYQNQEKSYRAIVKLGAVTASDDAEMPEENPADTEQVSKANVIEALQQFIGEIQQIPPRFSALKHKGKRAYKLARKNVDFELKPRTVNIYHIELKSFENPYADIIVRCSKGTYIRSLARDIGNELGCGAYLKELRRLSIGDYHVDNALTIKDILDYTENLKPNPGD